MAGIEEAIRKATLQRAVSGILILQSIPNVKLEPEIGMGILNDLAFVSGQVREAMKRYAGVTPDAGQVRETVTSGGNGRPA